MMQEFFFYPWSVEDRFFTAIVQDDENSQFFFSTIEPQIWFKESSFHFESINPNVCSLSKNMAASKDT